MKNPLLLVGAGPMAIAYAEVLKAKRRPFVVIGRRPGSAREFTEKTGIPVETGGIESFLKRDTRVPRAAIVAVDVSGLAKVTRYLLRQGCRRILVEKPAGLNARETGAVARDTRRYRAEIFVAYNRRFYASTQRALEMIAKDGGVRSFNFEFTEWSHKIAPLAKPREVKRNWFLANSSHVVDMAFFLGGRPVTLSAHTKGRLNWHPAASIFSGSGRSATGALFSYQANWESPGRWRVEVLTKKRRLILCPLEQLYVQKKGELNATQETLKDQDDKRFKPGVLRQTEAFLGGAGRRSLLPINEHLEQVRKVFSRICPVSSGA